VPKKKTPAQKLKHLSKVKGVPDRGIDMPIADDDQRDNDTPGPKWPKFIWATVTADNVYDGYWESTAEANARLKKECPGGRIIRYGTTARDYKKMDQEYAIHTFRSFIEDLCGYDIRHQPKR
jgi:hypothetical protein